MSFSPIAIVGQACVLPRALGPSQLWDMLARGEVAVSQPPENYWGLDPRLLLEEHRRRGLDGVVSIQGAYVRGFDSVFDPQGFHIAAGDVLKQDLLVQWILHAAREALAGVSSVAEIGAQRKGLILGNLAYPTASMTRLAESVWFKQARGNAISPPDPRNRFHSGPSAWYTARCLDFAGPAFCLDAACASSIYAFKLACNYLQDRRVDLMLAGGANRADDLLIHLGFTALDALSKTGQSRPFHRDADGLVPAEGVAVVALKRLEDAVASGDEILGVIRGIGLSHDGSRGGFLSPSMGGQMQALRQAYSQAGRQPHDVSFVECHATGTAIGDGVELQAMCKLFEKSEDLPIGSLKSNLGHSITTAGTAGLLKVLAAFKHQMIPASVNADPLRGEATQRPLRVVQSLEPWPAPGKRLAAVSAFGLGGTNAHLIVEEWAVKNSAASSTGADFSPTANTDAPSQPPRPDDIAIIGLAVQAADGADLTDFVRTLLYDDKPPESPQRMRETTLAANDLRFPPRDLQAALPQQVLVLRVCDDVLRPLLPIAGRTGVFVGMQCDVEAARCVARLRVTHPLDVEAAQARDAIAPPLEAAAVVGAMPNITANRINVKYDLQGQGFSISAEELSGIRALETAIRALRADELDLAVVAAVDLCHEPVHIAAAASVLPPDQHKPGDAAVAFVVKRLADAVRDGDEVLAVLDDGEPAADEKSGITIRLNDQAPGITPLFGHAHAAAGLLHVAAACVSLAYRSHPTLPGRGRGPWLQTDANLTATVDVTALGGQRATVRLRESPQTNDRRRQVRRPAPQVYLYSGGDVAEVLDALRQNGTSSAGPTRLVIVADSEAQHRDRMRAAEMALRDHGTLAFAKPREGVWFRPRPIDGETAFVFGSAAAAYPGMGRGLLHAFFPLWDELRRQHPMIGAIGTWYDPAMTDSSREPFDKLCGASALSQFHARFTQQFLHIKPHAAGGVSSGESNSLCAMGAWPEMGELLQRIVSTQLFSKQMGGQFEAVRSAWAATYDAQLAWANYRILAPVEMVQAAIREESRVHLAIIHTAADVVIAGDAAACQRIIQRLGNCEAIASDYRLAAHVPELAEVRELWQQIHTLPTEPVPDVRFYSHGLDTSYQPTSETATEAITRQAVQTVDMPRLIKRMWDDGMRVFIEHGPRNLYSGWIKEVLQDREHVAVSLDASGVDSLQQAAAAIAELLSAGVGLDYQAFNDRMREISGEDQAVASGTRLSFPAHLPEIRLPSFEPVATQIQTAEVRINAHAKAQAKSDNHLAGEQYLPLPPALPSIGTHVASRVLSLEPSTLRRNTEQDRSLVRQEPVAAPRVLARSKDPAAATVFHMSRAHQEYISLQLQVHKQFLSLREVALRRLSEGSELFQPRIELVEEPLVLQTAVQRMPVVIEPARPLPTEPVKELPVARKETNGQSSRTPTGPSFTRHELEQLASGKISKVFGPLFERQDGFHRQVRLPEPPLLLVDRVTGIDAEPGVAGRGTIWTETDVSWDAWYLQEGVMPVGLAIEAGQADLLLISWMGADFKNRDKRVYRLLGCDATLFGGLPRGGDTLRFQIEIDGHAQQGDVSLFFFHYDCYIDGELRLRVRNGQAGFFSTEELAATEGLLWKPEPIEELPPAQLDPPTVVCDDSGFAPEQVAAFFQGRLRECFGDQFSLGSTHVRTPRIAGPDLRLFDEVTEMSLRGGPWGRGYLRACKHISPDDWYFAGHFKNDPCMPGTLMLEGCLQTMAFYLTAMGFTLDKDGWRFEPVPDQTYPMRCRGQVLPTATEVIYEVFVHEVRGGAEPVLYADILGTVDGIKAFHCRRMGVRLVPDWPLTSWPESSVDSQESQRAVAMLDDIRGDFRSLMASAWGRPSDAFGQMCQMFDGPRRLPRLPGPPYHFMSRITKIDAQPGVAQKSAAIEMEYDVPRDAWYFDKNGTRVMPFCVLQEINLQPCGWLAMLLGTATRSQQDLYFRNLDGRGVVSQSISPDAGTILVKVRLTNSSKMGDITIVSFETESFVNGQSICHFETSFGFFTAAAFRQQVGVPTAEVERLAYAEPGNCTDDLQDVSLGGTLRLPEPMLLMFDRVTGFWPQGGKFGLGRVRAEQAVDVDAWYFKAHFFQDPVQAGSLGVQAMINLLQYYMTRSGLAEGIEKPQFEALALSEEIVWKYRGQVTPANQRVVVCLDITEVRHEASGVVAVAEARLWVDDKCIYHIERIAMRIVSGA